MLTTILFATLALTQYGVSAPTNKRDSTYAHVWSSSSGCTEKTAYTGIQLSMDIQDNSTATSACQDSCTADSKCASVMVDQLFPGSTSSWHQYYKCYLYASKFDDTTDVTCDLEPKWYGQVDVYDVANNS